MKKLIFIFIIFLTFTLLKANAQTWAPNGAEWHYNVGDGMQPGNAEYIHYKVTKDTIYAGKNSKKIEGTWYRYKDAEVIKLTSNFTYHSGDTVYYYNYQFKKYVPVFIFNVNPGDTLTFYYPWNNTSMVDSTYRIIIDSVKTISLNNIPLQEVYYSNSPDSAAPVLQSKYIERIGSLNMLFDPTEWIQPAIFHNYIRCYKDNEISFQHIDNLACDYRETTSILANEKQAKKLKISPNPATDKIRIENLSEGSYSYEIINQLGQRVLANKMDLTEREINVSGLPKGMYILKLSTNNNLKTEISKFIKE